MRGARNDWFDTLVGSYIAAAVAGGLSSTGSPAKRKRPVSAIINGRRVTGKADAAEDPPVGKTGIHAPSKHRAVIGRPSGRRSGFGQSWSQW